MSSSPKEFDGRCTDEVRSVLGSLGIALDTIAARALVLHPEPTELVVAEAGEDGRQHLLTPSAAAAWRALSGAAGADGVVIRIVSAFRSIERQAEIVRAKLQRGQSLEEILCVSAPPDTASTTRVAPSMSPPMACGRWRSSSSRPRLTTGSPDARRASASFCPIRRRTGTATRTNPGTGVSGRPRRSATQFTPAPAGRDRFPLPRGPGSPRWLACWQTAPVSVGSIPLCAGLAQPSGRPNLRSEIGPACSCSPRSASGRC